MKKPIQWKICQKCNKQVPAFFKTITVEGIRKKVCQTCAQKHDRLKEKAKKETVLKRKRIRRAKITEKKLDMVFSRLIRSLYPLSCMSCKLSLTFGTAQCAHFKGRNARSTRWDIRNCGVACMSCNYYDSSHAWELGNILAGYWGSNNPNLMREIGAKIYQFSDEQKSLLHSLFTEDLSGSLSEKRTYILDRYLEIMSL